MRCPCGNGYATRMRFYPKKSAWICEVCGDVGSVGVQDVYFKGIGDKYTNLTDETGKPVEFLSRGHKARFMRERGLIEAGDRVGGAPYTASGNGKIDRSNERQVVREAIQKAKRQLRYA